GDGAAPEEAHRGVPRHGAAARVPAETRRRRSRRRRRPPPPTRGRVPMKPSTTHSTATIQAQLLSLYGLKWNPFASGVPVEGLYCSPRIDAFGRRSEMYLREGGFAMLTGAPGLGKSWALRIIDDRLSRMRDVVVRSIEHPQSGVSDFYRELGDLFGVSLTP